MVVTGAGPGIMAAGLEGAGAGESPSACNIRLPFEPGPTSSSPATRSSSSMKYFFTRKLMLMKESAGFVALPGGFGTLDETFELLTLLQTGKAVPAPIVLLDEPGGTYWHGVGAVRPDEVAARGLSRAEDLLAVPRSPTTVEEAIDEIAGFYRNYHSIRWVGGRLVLRLRAAPTDDELEGLNRSSPTSASAAASRRPSRCRRRSPATTTSTCPASSCASTGTATAACGSSSTPSTGCRRPRLHHRRPPTWTWQHWSVPRRDRAVGKRGTSCECEETFDRGFLGH